jgi:LmbE family N-acetylglucosaminyl deacetylase
MMLQFQPQLTGSGTVLCLGAHCDDIEIGCGGALVELNDRWPGMRFVWVVLSGDSVREQETRAAAAALLGGANVSVEVHRFRESFFPYVGAEIKDSFESLRSRIAPDLILTHYLGDRHQDHRVVAELTWNTFRSHAILEYEIPKYEGDLGQPQVYWPLSAASVDLKIDTLMACFPTQRGRQWFDAELFRGHLRMRGVECNAPSRFAEAFHGRKILI